MASCEMCGKESTSLKPRVVAGSTVNVCNTCSIMGTMKDGTEKKSHNFTKYNKQDSIELEVVEDYAHVIQNGINKKGFTPHHVARAVNVKESTLSHYLKSQIKPDIVFARKLENFLDIKLVSEVSSSKVNVEDYKVSQEDLDSEMSLADMLLAKMKK